MNFGCLTCSSLNICLMCKTGYYLHTNNTCLLCSSKYPGCDICTSSKCLTCKTNYFYNTTSITGDCLICNSFLPGCSLCINQNQCLLC
jgi:proprotein convertase subtilisin/kexin type 5